MHDFAEHYSLGFTREDIITNQTFEAVAKALGNSEALKFIKWWRQKQGKLRQNPLWAKRIIIVHRGYPTTSSTTFYVSGSGGTSITTAPPYLSIFESPVSPTVVPPKQVEVYFSDFPDRTVTDMCTRAFALMESIVSEVEKQFELKL